MLVYRVARSIKMPQSRFDVILTYHSIDDSGSVLSTSPRIFTEQIRALSQLDADVVNIEEVARRRNDRGSAKPAIAITFDDGFSNVYEHAFPVLCHYGFPGTIFLVTDYCGGMNSWPGQPPGIIPRSLLSWNQIKEMSQAGITFGSHTRTHPNLTRLSTYDAQQELIGSKKEIEDTLGKPVASFAYPYGAYDDGTRELVTTHFALACSTALGFVCPGSDSFALERLDMYYFRRISLLRHLFSPPVAGYIHARRTLRSVRSRFLP